MVWQKCATDMDGRRGRFNKFCGSTINWKRQPQHILNCNDVVLTIWSSKTAERISHKTCLCSRLFVILIVMFLDQNKHNFLVNKFFYATAEMWKFSIALMLVTRVTSYVFQLYFGHI